MFNLEKISNDVKFHVIFVNYCIIQIFKVEPEPGQSDGSSSETLVLEQF